MKADSTKSGFFCFTPYSRLFICLFHTLMVNKVFIIDDEPINTFIVKQMAMKVSMAKDYVVFNDSESALNTLLEMNEDDFPELILVDINMPVCDGWDIVTQLEEKRSHLRPFIIFLTSSIAHEDRVRAKKYPSIQSYLVKPISSNDLLTVLQAYESSR